MHYSLMVVYKDGNNVENIISKYVGVRMDYYQNAGNRCWKEMITKDGNKTYKARYGDLDLLAMKEDNFRTYAVIFDDQWFQVWNDYEERRMENEEFEKIIHKEVIQHLKPDDIIEILDYHN